jgi:hypothetical protein
MAERESKNADLLAVPIHGLFNGLSFQSGEQE